MFSEKIFTMYQKKDKIKIIRNYFAKYEISNRKKTFIYRARSTLSPHQVHAPRKSEDHHEFKRGDI